MTGRRGVGIGQHAHADVLEDVAWLRANGYRFATNRQIAERIGISVKTLERHLYGKEYREAVAA